MTYATALSMLAAAQLDPSAKIRRARIIPIMTQHQAIEIVRKGLIFRPPDNPETFEISTMYERRVWQVVKNQKRPKY
jgi:hypothetical protein